MNYSGACVLTFVLLIAVATLGCSTISKPMRFFPPSWNDDDSKYIHWDDPNTWGAIDWEGVPASKRAYIQSQASVNQQPFSCSFVEFDGHGDFIDYRQHRFAYKAVHNLAKNGPLLLVIYCHGWKNNSQSSDVVRFNAYLSMLADSAFIKEKKYRVHGVYISWRGNTVHPYVDRCDEEHFFCRNLNDFNEPIVDKSFQRRWNWTGRIQENADYWSRRSAAEHEVTGVAMARTIFWCANAAKKTKRDDRTTEPLNRVFLIGHSMGALVLEQSVLPACTGMIADQLPWWNRDYVADIDENLLPFDLVLLVNSAAPSIYAKQTRDILASYEKALNTYKLSSADAPIFMSLTSSADWATGKLHPAANYLKGFGPTHWRKYDYGVVIQDRHHPVVRERYFYRKTPGHNPLLVNHWVLPAGTAPNQEVSAMEYNLSLRTANERFLTGQSANHPAGAWKIYSRPDALKKPDDNQWKYYKDVEIAPPDSDYWILRCGPDLINGHGDIWTQTTMDLYTALYRIAILKKKDFNNTVTEMRSKRILQMGTQNITDIDNHYFK